jgi:hypothetical protein
VFESRTIERAADGADSPIHHVGRGDHIAASLGLHKRLPAEHCDRFIVDDVAVAKEPVMAVAGIGVECDVTDDANGLPVRLLHGSNRAADEILRVDGFISVRRFLGRIGHREQGHGGNAQLNRAADGVDQPVNRQPLHAGHGRHGLTALAAVEHKQRPDQIVDREPRLGHQPPRPLEPPQPAEPHGGKLPWRDWKLKILRH